MHAKKWAQPSILHSQRRRESRYHQGRPQNATSRLSFFSPRPAQDTLGPVQHTACLSAGSGGVGNNPKNAHTSQLRRGKSESSPYGERTVSCCVIACLITVLAITASKPSAHWRPLQRSLVGVGFGVDTGRYRSIGSSVRGSAAARDRVACDTVRSKRLPRALCALPVRGLQGPFAWREPPPRPQDHGRGGS